VCAPAGEWSGVVRKAQNIVRAISEAEAENARAKMGMNFMFIIEITNKKML
jgi:hypothetical protein